MLIKNENPNIYAAPAVKELNEFENTNNSAGQGLLEWIQWNNTAKSVPIGGFIFKAAGSFCFTESKYLHLADPTRVDIDHAGQEGGPTMFTQ